MVDFKISWVLVAANARVCIRLCILMRSVLNVVVVEAGQIIIAV